MAGRDSGIRVEGLREFQRACQKLSPALAKELRRELKDAGAGVAAEAKAHAPRRSGRYANSVRVYSRAKGVSVGSRLPQAGVLHWGGTIKPRGVEIRFQARPVVAEAIRRREARILAAVETAFERAARSAGWR